uniref:Uncharacterized protein n=1 Tax=Anguilla anguilla TaxID=7936 RepID=A0A0E9U973_ANGAN
MRTLGMSVSSLWENALR